MKPGRSPASALVLLTVLLLPVMSTANEEPYPELAPSPGLSAEEVVRIQLGALARNDDPYPDAGIEITFRFASPGNREVTGPLPRFVALVKNPAYKPMIGHKAVEYGPGSMREGRFVLPVVLTSRDGKKVSYLFVVGKHDNAGCTGCWMTEAVFRVPTGNRNDGPERPGMGA